jgi:ADP-ribosylglycohydrolase
MVERDSNRYHNTDDKQDIRLFENLLNLYFLNKRFKNHIRDGILGLVVGDALGVPVEFKSRENLKYNPVVDMIGNGTYNLPAGTWSDDSSMALCLAEELIKGYNLKSIGNSFMGWLYENHWTPNGSVFDVGIATRQAIERIRDGAEPHLAGNDDEYSNGNGSLMRILPLLFYIRSIENNIERYKIIKDVSSITHAHVRSCLACYYYLEFADNLCDGYSIEYAYSKANESFHTLSKELAINKNEIAKFNRLLTDNISQLKEGDILPSGYVIHTLEASIWCLMTTKSYKEALLKAVNLSEDTDTTGAVTGGLAGIIYGADNIPEQWLNKIARLGDIEDLITKFTARYRQAGH